MALSQSPLSELLDALRAGGDLDVVREALALVLQALIDAEATQHIGARPYERTEQRTAHRNGTRARLLSTKAGDVELRIPKLREGSFFPALLEPRRRIDRALLAVVMEAYVHGTSTRKVDDLVKAASLEVATGWSGTWSGAAWEFGHLVSGREANGSPAGWQPADPERDERAMSGRPLRHPTPDTPRHHKPVKQTFPHLAEPLDP
jgi:Transposase, Mutator family